MEKIYGALQGMFHVVIRTEDFILAPDTAGVFLFTNESDTQEVLVKAMRVMKQLELNQKEIVVCIVYEDAEECFSSGEPINLKTFATETEVLYKAPIDNLSDFVSIAAIERGTVLDWSCVEDVIGCYVDLPEVQTSLETALLRKGLSSEMAAALSRLHPPDREGVLAAGVAEEDVARVLAILEKQYWQEAAETAGRRFEYIGMPVGPGGWSRETKRKHLIILALYFAAFIVFKDYAIMRVWISPLGLFYGLYVLRHLCNWSKFGIALIYGMRVVMLVAFIPALEKIGAFCTMLLKR